MRVAALALPDPARGAPMTQIGRSPLDPWIEIELAASGRRTLLVDGFNVLHTVLLAGARDSLWWGRAARDRLLERVALWPESGDAIWVAFDGAQPAWSVLAVEIIGPGPERPARGPIVHSLFVESADDWIVRRARRAEVPERTVVVSADRKVAGRARSAGCLVWSPWTFIAGCGAGKPEPSAEARTAADEQALSGLGGAAAQDRLSSERAGAPERAELELGRVVVAEVGAPIAPRPSPIVAS